MQLNVGFLFLFTLFFQVICIGQTKTVIAIKGDGIYTILRKNNLDPVKYYQDFISLNKKNLNANNGLYVGKEYFLPIKKEEENKDSTIKTDSIATKKLDSLSLKKKLNTRFLG